MKHGIYYIFLVVAMWLMTGCTEAEPEAQEPDARPVLIDAGGGCKFEAYSFSRGMATPSGDKESREAILPETCGLFGEMQYFSDDIFYDQIVYRKDGDLYNNKYSDPTNTIKTDIETQLGEFKWPPDNNWVYAPLKYWSGSTMFQFYCYAPHTSIDGTSVRLVNNSFDAMEYFEMTHIPPYSSYDYTTASRWVKQNTGAKPVPFKDDTGSSTDPKTNAQMIHVSARICIRMRIGQKYSEMRRIRVKEVTVDDRTEGSYFQYRMTFDNVNNQTGNKLEVSPNGEYMADPNAKITVIPIFNDADGLELISEPTPEAPTGYRQFGSLYVMPQTMKTLTINVVYDVYDKVSNTPIRRDQMVKNTITLKDNNNDYLNVESGKYYEINIVVSPKYLYVLSDNDIEPDIIISPEEDPASSD